MSKRSCQLSSQRSGRHRRFSKGPTSVPQMAAPSHASVVRRFFGLAWSLDDERRQEGRELDEINLVRRRRSTFR